MSRFGWIPDVPDARDHLYAVTAPVPLPTHVDLRGAHMPAVYDQGELGSCTANAIAAALEYDRLVQGLDHWTPSRLFIYYNERAMEHTTASDAGAQIRDGIKSVTRTRYGAAREPLWPYDVSRFSVRPPITAYADAKLHPSITYRRVANGSLYQMRHALAIGARPVVIGFTVYDSFMSDAVATSGIVQMPLPDEAVQGGHAILVVGYDDPTLRFIVRNSWGSEWGDQGYCYMPYAYLTDQNLADDAWTITLVR